MTKEKRGSIYALSSRAELLILAPACLLARSLLPDAITTQQKSINEMYSVWTRANALFFTSLMALAVMCTLTSFSTYLHQPKPIVTTLELNTLHSLRNYRDKTDRATLSFDLDADLSSVFNWNVKQIFVYVVAEYESERNAKNQVVIWDKIVQTKEDAATLQFQDEGVEYFLSDQYDQLRGANVTLRLEWDVMPVCGRLFVYSEGRSSFVLPSKYQGKAPRGRY